jgi:hypothetical protein
MRQAHIYLAAIQTQQREHIDQVSGINECRMIRANLPNYDDLISTLTANGEWWISFVRKVNSLSQSEIVIETLPALAERTYTSSIPIRLATLAIAYARCSQNPTTLLSIVDIRILSNFSYAATVEGIRCLVLLGNSYTDIGQLRRAWFIWRKGMTTLQLMV